MRCKKKKYRRCLPFVRCTENEYRDLRKTEKLNEKYHHLRFWSSIALISVIYTCGFKEFLSARVKSITNYQLPTWFRINSARIPQEKIYLVSICWNTPLCRISVANFPVALLATMTRFWRGSLGQDKELIFDCHVYFYFNSIGAKTKYWCHTFH